jgi:cyclin A
MRKLEQEYRPKPNYIKKQADITSSMRSILVDWLVEVAEEYKLNTETLHLAVNYTDRFLSQMAVLRSKLQLVGTSCMYIAAKYEEITPPDVSEFVYITDETYTKKQVLRMEHLLLKTLDFRVSQPTANWFLTHYLKFMKLGTNLAHGNQSDMFQRIECLARYLAELTLLDCETFLVYLPSQIAASAVYLSLLTLNKPWTKQIAELVGYNHDLSELKSCIADMFKLYEQAATLPQQAIQDKYKQAKYEHISLVDPPKSLPFEIPTKQNENEA